MFWKKVNRGLLLGAALLIFLVGFIVVDILQFNREKPVIEDRCKEYLTSLFDLQCNLQGEIGKTLSASSAAAQKDKMNQALKAHWYGDLDEGEYSGHGVNDVQIAYNKYLQKEVSVLLSSAELQVRADNVEIKKDGPNRAIVRLTADVKIACKGNEYGLFYGYYEDYGYDTPVTIEGEDPQATDDSTKETTLYLSMQFELYRVKGEWKIVSFDSGRYYW